MARKTNKTPVIESTQTERQKAERAAVIKNLLAFNESDYTFDDKFTPWDPSKDGTNVHTTHELYELAKRDEKIQIEGTTLAYKEGKLVRVPINREKFMEAFKANSRRKFREAYDAFLTDQDIASSSGNLIGQDYIPLMGGPFHKQLYLYDYLRMNAYSFWAYNHWPVCKRAVDIMASFTLGRGYRVDIKRQSGGDHPEAEALWAAFESVNDLPTLMTHVATELSRDGEVMFWWLPNQQTKIAFQVRPGQEPPTGIIPRIRLIDPSCIYDIATYPEDITRVLFYQWVSPTQYQIYTGNDGGSPVPGTKFIMQQIPADQVDHYKVNCSSNEKRGRSDLFAGLGFAKRLTDTVNYSLVGLQKAVAWSIDTTIEGTQSDIDAYVQSQQQMGTIPTSGSEFVHTKKVERKYLGNEATAKGGDNPVFDWSMNMFCSAVGIPTNYFGMHHGGGSTRANAFVATDPVLRHFEMRQLVYQRMLTKMAKRLFKTFGIKDAVIEVTMPELMTQDRSAKLKDLALAEMQGWISHERAATIASKELNIDEYDVDIEMEKIKQDREQGATEPEPGPLSQGTDGQERSGLEDRKELAQSGGF